MGATLNSLAILILLYCRVDIIYCTGETCNKDCGQVNASACPIIPWDPCRANISKKLCVDDKTYIGDPSINAIHDPTLHCCDDLKCVLPDGIDHKLRPRLEVLNSSWTAVNLSMATLHLWWKGEEVGHGYRLTISINNNVTVRCMCLSENFTNYSVNVSLTSAPSLHIKITRLPVSRGVGKVTTTNKTVIKIPSDCWNTSDYDLALEKCGPSAPLHLTVDIVSMTINWEPPPTYDTGINITAYKIVINNSTILITNQTEYQHNITDGAVKKYVIEVRASYDEVVNLTDYNITADSEALSWGQAAVVTKLLPSASTVPTVGTSTTTSNSSIGSTTTISSSSTTTISSSSTTTISSSSSNKPGILLITLLSAAGSILLLVIVVVVVVITRYVRLRKANPYTPLTVHIDSFAVKQVFIINALQSNDKDLLLIRRLCHSLAKNSVKPMIYEYFSFDRHHGPGHSGVCQWAENNFTKCDMTLFVCNRSFHEAWTGSTDQDSLVSATKALLEGHVSNGGDMSQFGVILLRQHDQEYIPSLYLKGLQKFVVFRDKLCVVEALLNHIYSS